VTESHVSGSPDSAPPPPLPDLPDPPPARIGIVAGEGNFPVLVAEGARMRGIGVVVFSIRGLGSEKLASLADRVYDLKLAQLSRLVDLARENDVNHLVLAGRVPHSILLKQISFDRRILGVLLQLKDRKAKSLLGAVIAELEKEGFHVLDSTLFLRHCVPGPGLLTPRRPPDEETGRDIAFGFPLAREIARLDIGQTLAVRKQIIVAVEALEGTDKLIRRAGELAGPGVVFVKVSRPNQDMRYDVPVVGLQTIENLVAVKAAALCLEAGRSLFFDREQAIARAEKHKISILAR